MKISNYFRLFHKTMFSMRGAAQQLFMLGAGLALLFPQGSIRINTLVTSPAPDHSVRMSDLIFDTDKDQVAEPLYRHSQDSYPSLSPMDNKKEIHLG